MKSYSSSTIKLFDKHCPQALGYQEAGYKWNSEWNTAPGIAAHAICQMAGEYARNNDRAPGRVELHEKQSALPDVAMTDIFMGGALADRLRQLTDRASERERERGRSSSSR